MQTLQIIIIIIAEIFLYTCYLKSKNLQILKFKNAWFVHICVVRKK